MERIKKYLFLNTETKQTIIKNTIWLFIGEFGIRILKLIIFIYAARKLGVSEWGVFSYALALMSFFSIFSDIGLNSVLLKKTAQNNESQPQYIATSFFLKLGLSIISGLALLSIFIFLRDDNLVKTLIPITAILLFFDTMREFGFSLNRAFEKMEIEAFTKISSTFLLILLGFIFIKFNPKASSLLYAYVISSLLGLFIMYLSLKKYFQDLKLNFNKKLLIPIWKEVWPVGLAGALGTIMVSIDMIILGWFKPLDQIGLYSTAQKLIQILYLLPVLISTAVLPAFARFASTDLIKMRNMTKKMINISFKFTIPIVIICFLLGGPLIIILFGKLYIGSIVIFKIMSLAIITGVPSSIIGNAMFAENKQKKLIHFILISLIINIVLCLITIPIFGIIGAAISVTLSQTIGNLFLIINYKKIII